MTEDVSRETRSPIKEQESPATRQYLFVLFVLISVVFGIWAAFFWGQAPSYSVLFSRLDQFEAGLVIDSLQRYSVNYTYDDETGTILVPSKQLQDVKLRLAEEELPRSGVDRLAPRKHNSDKFVDPSTEYQLIKAKLELDLARTISRIKNIKSARVHIALPENHRFVTIHKKPSAAVVVSLYPGRELSGGQVAAISHMVSSSVPGLLVNEVTIVDHRGKLLTHADAGQALTMSSTQFEYAKKVEQSYIQRIEDILIPVVGAHALRAQVTVDLDFTYNEKTQESIFPDDPQSGSAASPRKMSKRTVKENNLKTKLPARNLSKVASAGARAIENNEKTISVTRYAMGGLRRLSAAIVIDDVVSQDENVGIIRTPRSPEEIHSITELVKKAIGFNEERGDSVNVVNVTFTKPPLPQPLPEPSIWEKPWVWDISKQIAGVLMLLFVLLLLRKLVINSFVKHQHDKSEVAENSNNSTHATSSKPEPVSSENVSPFDKNMHTAIQTVQQDPKLVAQVVKRWVATDG